MIHRGVLVETLIQSFSRWSPSESFMQALLEKIVNFLVFIAPVTIFVKQRVINAVEEGLSREPPVTKDLDFQKKYP